MSRVERRHRDVRPTRRAVLAACGAALAAGCTAPDVIGGGREDVEALSCDRTGGWRQHQGDAANSGVATPLPAIDGERDVLVEGLDELAVGAGVAVDADGRAFTGEERAVLAADPDDGAELWRRSLRTDVVGTPVLSCDGVVVQTRVRTVALDAVDGSVLWKREQNNAKGAPVADGETLYVPDDITGALDVASGEVRWTAEFDEGVSPQGCCLADGTLVLCGRRDGGGFLAGVDPESGERRWRTDLGVRVNAAPVSREGTVYVPDEANGVHAVAAASGERVWRAEPYEPYPGDRRGSTPTVVGSTVVVPGGNGAKTVGVDAETGASRWRIETGPVLAPPLSTPDGALVGTANEGLFLVSPDGEVVARATDTRAGAPMALTDAGLFYKTLGPGTRVELVRIPG